MEWVQVSFPRVSTAQVICRTEPVDAGSGIAAPLPALWRADVWDGSFSERGTVSESLFLDTPSTRAASCAKPLAGAIQIAAIAAYKI